MISHQQIWDFGGFVYIWMFSSNSEGSVELVMFFHVDWYRTHPQNMVWEAIYYNCEVSKTFVAYN